MKNKQQIERETIKKTLKYLKENNMLKEDAKKIDPKLLPIFNKITSIYEDSVRILSDIEKVELDAYLEDYFVNGNI